MRFGYLPLRPDPAFNSDPALHRGGLRWAVRLVHSVLPPSQASKDRQ